MEQVHQHVIRRPGKILPHQWNAAHDFGELVQGHGDEIDLAGNGAIVWVVSVTKTTTKSECAVARKIVLNHAEGLRFGCAQHVNVRY